MTTLLLANFIRQQNIRRQRVFRDRNNPFEAPPDDFIRKYRLTKENVVYLCDELRETLAHKTKRNHSLSVEMQVLTALRYFASGSFQAVVGDDGYHEIHQAAVSRIIHRVINALILLSSKYIKFPVDNHTILKIKRFFEKYGFPNVIGAIDCTHVRIKKPSVEDSYVYINRK